MGTIFLFLVEQKEVTVKKCVSDYQKKYAALHLNERRNDRLKRQYGITLDDYNEIFLVKRVNVLVVYEINLNLKELLL